MDKRIKFYSQNTNLLPPKPKSSFRHLKQGIQEFHRKYVLVPADKAANNVLYIIDSIILILLKAITYNLYIYNQRGVTQLINIYFFLCFYNLLSRTL